MIINKKGHSTFEAGRDCTNYIKAAAAKVATLKSIIVKLKQLESRFPESDKGVPSRLIGSLEGRIEMLCQKATVIYKLIVSLRAKIKSSASYAVLNAEACKIESYITQNPIR